MTLRQNDIAYLDANQYRPVHALLIEQCFTAAIGIIPCRNFSLLQWNKLTHEWRSIMAEAITKLPVKTEERKAPACTLAAI